MHCAPADDRIVVSEIGDTWSPYTAPPSVAPMATRNSGSCAGNTPITMGRISAMVPHDVPMAKPMNAATTKMTTGSRASPTPMLFRKLLTNSPVPSR